MRLPYALQTFSALLIALPLAIRAADSVREQRFTAATPSDARAWQEAAREKLFSLMMGGRRPEPGPLAPQLLQREQLPDRSYMLEEITLQTLPDRRAHAWLARPIPLKAKVGAVLALHGHGGTGEQVVRGQSLYWYGRVLAELGYVVIAPDIGQHELQHSSWSLMGERTWDALRCLEYVRTLPEVDSNRLAVVGLSLGGETTMYVAALDESIRLADSSGWLTTVANMKNGHCPCFNFPGLEETFDFADIFSCVAPRTLVCELGEQERAPGGFPVETGRKAADEIRAAYRVFEAESNLVLTVHAAGHVFDGRDFWPRLASALGDPVRDRSVVPVAKSGEAFPEMRHVWDSALALPNTNALHAALLRQAEQNSRLAAEGLFRSRRYVDGWLAHADPVSGLIPRNLTDSVDFWNGRDSGADNYPFMVLTAALTDRPLMEGRLLDILRTETRLTSRLDRLPDDYSFSKRGWRRETVNLDSLVFDGAEYVKDGLLPLAEWLGQSPWSERMLGIIDDIWKNAPIDTAFGKIPTLNFEVNGDLLQACSRLYWVTGDRKYLDWAMRLGDYYLLGTNHPTRDMKELRLMDHGCEVINGLSELYVAVSYALPEKKALYREPLHALLDRVLELGRNEDGLLYTAIYPQTSTHASPLSDTWGYDYDAFYTVYLLDGTEPYRAAVRKVLGNLKGKYVGAPWADKSADGYADSIEGAINLYRREPVASAADWIDSQTRLMWSMQKRDGVIEGWHGDGNFARTTLMYVLWKSQGVHLEPWRADLRLGAVRDGDALLLCAGSDQPWAGRVIFDQARHKTHMRLPLDYPRINQFPEWFVVEPGEEYGLEDLVSGERRTLRGAELQRGLTQELRPGALRCWRVARASE